MEDDLNFLLNNPEVVDKILKAYVKYGTMSATYLAHKFRFDADMAYRIMKIIEKHKKTNICIQ